MSPTGTTHDMVKPKRVIIQLCPTVKFYRCERRVFITVGKEGQVKLIEFRAKEASQAKSRMNIVLMEHKLKAAGLLSLAKFENLVWTNQPRPEPPELFKYRGRTPRQHQSGGPSLRSLRNRRLSRLPPVDPEWRRSSSPSC